METGTGELPQIEAKESIKLIKNTKGYNWEIKILELDVDKLEKLNTELERRFKKDDSGQN